MTFAEIRLFEGTMEAGLKLFAPERGGSYVIFNKRPMPQSIVEYCSQAVKYLPRLWTTYNSKLTLA